MLSVLAGSKRFLYDPISNTMHNLSNETEECQINLLDKKVCYVCDTEEQIKEIALTEGHFEITRCPHCYQK